MRIDFATYIKIYRLTADIFVFNKPFLKSTVCRNFIKMIKKPVNYVTYIAVLYKLICLHCNCISATCNKRMLRFKNTVIYNVSIRDRETKAGETYGDFRLLDLGLRTFVFCVDFLGSRILKCFFY